jgi:ligand-binding sensor domain-containing protein
VNALACDQQDGVWLFLTDRGLAKIADSSDPGYDFPNLHADSKGRIWLGQNDSIEMFDHGSKRRFGARDGLTAKLIRAFAEDKAGGIWVASEAVLAKFDHDRFRSLSRSNGLPSQSIFDLAENDDGNWWIACDAGVLRIRAGELEHALNDPAYRVPYELFNLLDGLPARAVAQPLPILAKTADGRI